MSFFKQWAKYFFGWTFGIAATAGVFALLWYMMAHPATPLVVIGVIVYLFLVYAYIEYKGY